MLLLLLCFFLFSSLIWRGEVSVHHRGQKKTEGTNQVWILVRLEIVFNEVLVDPPAYLGSGIPESSKKLWNISEWCFLTENINRKMAIQLIQNWQVKRAVRLPFVALCFPLSTSHLRRDSRVHYICIHAMERQAVSTFLRYHLRATFLVPIPPR